jgi:type IV pilus assembly protein PilC
MATFKYIAKDDNGKEYRDTIAAKSRDEVMGVLRRKGLFLVELEEKGFFRLGKPRAKVKLEEMVIFTRQLSTMISAGIPLLESLEILQEQQENKGFAAALGDIVDRV